LAAVKLSFSVLTTGLLFCLILQLQGEALAAGPSKPDTTETLCRQAKRLYVEGKLGLSILSYERAVVLGPDNLDAYRGRGLAYLAMGRLERAIADFDRANEELGPYREQKFPGIGGYLEWQRAHEQYELANNLLKSKDFEGACASYKLALAIYPTFPQCLHNLGIALSKRGDHDAAARRCMEAISYRQTDWKFWKTLALELYAQGRYRIALQAMEHAKELKPPVPEEVEIIESIENIKDALVRAHQ
jgi:tetratricopeptide (TPR) repeat protein